MDKHEGAGPVGEQRLHLWKVRNSHTQKEMNKEILLGYEVGTAKPVKIRVSHIIVTGITQLSGKTTTLEALIKRSGLRAIVFKTKVGETGFTEGTMIPPYFKERSDWQYVSSLLEATLKERLKFERAWIIEVCKNADSLLEVKHNIDKKLAEDKLRSLSRSIYTTLQAYFELVLPQLQYANFSRTLTLQNGINIMDLERFKEEIQSLVIRSVLETILNEYKETIVVMPEAWKFLPQGRGSPCKRVAEAFIRQGATNDNYLWFDCQDLAGVDKTPIKQVSTWILGLQQERNEVKHTLDQIALPKKAKPKEDEIMRLSLGHFIATTPKFTTRVYVQPAWLDKEVAKKIALGELHPEEVEKPSSLTPFSYQSEAKTLPDLESRKFYMRMQQDIAELRKDFFDKIQQVQDYTSKNAEAITRLQLDKPELNLDEVVSKVLQKMPIQNVNKQEIISEVLARIPKMRGIVIYEVAPLEKLQKDLLEEAKKQILSEISSLDSEEKKMLKFIESLEKRTNISEIMEKNLFLNPSSGSRRRISNKIKTLESLQFIKRDGSHIYANLKQKIKAFLELHKATEPEIDQVYNHIIMELL